MRRQFGKTIVEIGRKDPKLVLLYGDVKQEMDEFEKEFPDRIFNVGICEQSMVSMAAGMAIEGLHPVVYSLTPFVTERAFEQIKLDVDHQKLPVLLCGFSDYATHGPTQSPVDTRTLCSLLKNTRYYQPATLEETRQALLSAWDWMKAGFPSVVAMSKYRD